MGRDTWYPAFVSVLRKVLCWCSAFWIFTMAEHGAPMGIHVGAYLVFALVCWGFFACFLRRPRSIPVLAAAGAAMAVAGSVVLLWKFSTLRTPGFCFWGVISVISVVFFAVRSSLEPVTAAQSISGLETSTLFLLFFLWAQDVYGWPFAYSLPLLASSALSASAVVFQRLSDVSGAAGRGKLRGAAAAAVMLAVIAGVLVLFLKHGAAALGQGALLVYYSVIYCLKLGWRMLEMLLYWLAALLPEEEGTLLAEPPAEIVAAGGMAEEMQLPAWLLVLLGVLGICAVLAALCWLLFRLRKVRLGGRTMGRPAETQRKRLSFRQWLRRLWDRFYDRLRLLYFSLTRRGTPQELYLYLRRSGKRLGCRPLPGETPCAFVRRAADAAADGALPAFPEAMALLEQSLGACLYAREEPGPLPGDAAQCIRRSFGRARRRVWRERLRRMLTEKRKKTGQLSRETIGP